MNIFESIANVMKEIGVIGKDSKNQQQGFMYRGVDAVMNALNPALVKYKVFVAPEVLEQTREERTTSKGNALLYTILKVKYTFYAEDGSNVSCVVVGEGMDSGDKSSNKALSVAFKYACFQIFCIPTEEMIDPDAECHEVASKTKSEVPRMSKNIDAEQKTKILAQLNRTGVTIETLLSMVKAPTIDDIPASAFDSVMKKFLNTPNKEK